LKTAGKLGSDEREFVQLKNFQWTEAQRADAQNYRAGLVVQFHQNVCGFQRGKRVTVTGREPGRVQVGRNNGESTFLPLDAAARFHVYESRTIALTAEDRIRITQNGFASDGQRLNNGDLKQVKGFTKDGGIKLTNGWVIPKDYGHVAHRYCVTSYNSQSKGVDCVFVAEGSESFRAADREQFYVSASRFKEALTIYTDDKLALLDAVRKTSHRASAMDLVKGQLDSLKQEFRTVRPMRQKRTTRLTQLAPVQRLARVAEHVRQRLMEAISPGEETVQEQVQQVPVEKFALTVEQAPRLHQNIKHHH
jgi:hypothetical protein